jgi:hypothetical protein
MLDSQFDILRNFIKGKGYSVASLARKLKVARQTVYTQLNKVPLEADFILLVKKGAGLDLGIIPVPANHPPPTQYPGRSMRSCRVS